MSRFVPQLTPAREYARRLEAAGFSSNLDQDARDNVSVYVGYGDLNLGRINVWISGSCTYHEIKVEAFAQAIRLACNGNVDTAQSLAAEAATSFVSRSNSWTAYVTSTGSAKHSAFGIAMMKNGVDCGGAAGDIDAATAWADIEGTTRIVKKANAGEIDRMVIHAPSQVVAYAAGSLSSSSPYVTRLRASLTMGTKVTFVLLDPHSEGFRLAKLRANDRFSMIQRAA